MSKLNEDSQFQSIPIDDFAARPLVVVDTYIKLPNGKYILIAKAGANTPFENIEKYKAKNVATLFVRVHDYNRLVGEMIRAAGKQGQSREVPSKARFEVIQQAMEAVYREANDLGFNDQVYAHAKLVNHSTLVFVSDHPKLTEILEKVGKQSDDHMRHSMMVSMISVMIGSALEWQKPGTLEKLGLGAFFHDIGKSKLPIEILSKPLAKLSNDERTIYESHPELGAQILAASGDVPDDVRLIVYEHHERSDGTGYPRGLKDAHISPLARVVALANAFTDAIIDDARPLNSEISARVAKDLEAGHFGPFNRDALKALARCLKSADGKGRIAG